jgi:hypothetical protein
VFFGVRFVPVSCIKEGILLGRTLLGSNGEVLLKAGTEMRKSYIYSKFRIERQFCIFLTEVQIRTKIIYNCRACGTIENCGENYGGC